VFRFVKRPRRSGGGSTPGLCLPPSRPRLSAFGHRRRSRGGRNRTRTQPVDRGGAAAGCSRSAGPVRRPPGGERHQGPGRRRCRASPRRSRCSRKAGKRFGGPPQPNPTTRRRRAPRSTGRYRRAGDAVSVVVNPLRQQAAATANRQYTVAANTAAHLAASQPAVGAAPWRPPARRTRAGAADVGGQVVAAPAHRPGAASALSQRLWEACDPAGRRVDRRRAARTSAATRGRQRKHKHIAPAASRSRWRPVSAGPSETHELHLPLPGGAEYCATSGRFASVALRQRKQVVRRELP